jgi:hypothetical protein
VNGPFPWYVARAAGLVSWGLLATATLWGLALSTKVFGRRPRANWLLDLHRLLGGLAVVFTAIHVLALLADRYVRFSATEVLVPLASSWRPGAVALGVVALYMVLAVELTSLARARLPHRLWRSVHFASFPLFVSATVHGLLAGTDTGSFVAVGVASAVSVTFLALAGLRTMEAAAVVQ